MNKLLPKDVMNTIYGYLQRFPADKEGRELRKDYLTQLNEKIILASEQLTKEA